MPKADGRSALGGQVVGHHVVRHSALIPARVTASNLLDNAALRARRSTGCTKSVATALTSTAVVVATTMHTTTLHIAMKVCRAGRTIAIEHVEALRGGRFHCSNVKLIGVAQNHPNPLYWSVFRKSTSVLFSRKFYNSVQVPEIKYRSSTGCTEYRMSRCPSWAIPSYRSVTEYPQSVQNAA